MIEKQKMFALGSKYIEINIIWQQIWMNFLIII